MNTKILRPKLLSWTAGLLFSVTVFAQGSGSHGGDGLVFEFTGTANNFADQLVAAGGTVACPNPADFKRWVSTDRSVPEFTQVQSKPVVLVNFIEQDADSDAARRLITLNRSRIVNLTDPLAYLNVVVHEYFVVRQLETTNDNSKSQACIQSLRSAGLDDARLVKLVFRIDPITTFERQFAEAKAALSCGTGGYAFLFSEWNGRGSKARFGYAINKNGLLIRHSPVGERYAPSEVIGAFKSEYSVAEGLTRFRAQFNDACSTYSLVSLDHNSWTVKGTYTNSDCTAIVNGVRYRVNRGGVSFSVAECTPVYYQQRPEVLPRDYDRASSSPPIFMP